MTVDSNNDLEAQIAAWRSYMRRPWRFGGIPW